MKDSYLFYGGFNFLPKPFWIVHTLRWRDEVGRWSKNAHIWGGNFSQGCTLMTLLRILFFGRIGSTKLVLPKWQNIDILNRDNRVLVSCNLPPILISWLNTTKQYDSSLPHPLPDFSPKNDPKLKGPFKLSSTNKSIHCQPKNSTHNVKPAHHHPVALWHDHSKHSGLNSIFCCLRMNQFWTF